MTVPVSRMSNFGRPLGPLSQIVKVRPTLTQCQSFGLARAPSDVKVSDTAGRPSALTETHERGDMKHPT